MKDNVYPFWYKLISFLKSQNKIRLGLTIPYIIGAKTILGESNVITKKSIEILLNEIINSSTENIPFFQECRDIRQYVIGVIDKNHTDTVIKYESFLSNANGDKKLYVLGDASDFGSSVGEISQKLNELYLSALMEKRFSWDRNEKEWRPFSEDEKEIIKALYL